MTYTSTNHTARRRKLALLAATAISLLATRVHAEAAAADADSGATVDEVVVTAERRSTNLQDTPIAITAFSDQVLKDRKIDNIRDLAGQVPNLTISRVTISHTTQTYSLRGIGESDPIQEPVLAVYVDDVYLPRQIGSMVEFTDLQRIEVLRGPQGTLYGRNSSAGALRIITEDPGQEFHVRADVGVGNYGAVDVRALISGPIVDDKLSGSFSYIHHTRDGVTFDPTLNHDVNRINVDAYRAKLHWTPTSRLDVLFTASATRDRSDSRSYIPVVQPGGGFDPRKSFSEVEPYQKLDGASGSVRVTYDLSDSLKLKSITSYGGFDLNPVNYDNDGQAALVQKNLIHYNDQYYTQEVQLNGDYGPFKFTTGVFYLHERFYVQRDGYSRKNATLTDPTVTPGNYNFLRAHNVTNTDSIALFGEVNWAATDQLSFTAGLRGTSEKKTFTFANSVLNLAGQVTAPSINGEADKTWSSVTPKLSVQYKWTPDILTYATWAKGFKAGGFDNRATRLDLAELPFDPETVSSFELGLKSEWFDRRVRANLAVFYNDYTNLQVSFYDPAYVGSRRGNAGKATSYGVELETDTRFTERLGVQFSVGYLDAHYDEYKGAGGLGVDADGHKLIGAPRWSVSGGATYDVPVSIPGSLRIGVDAQFQSSIYSSALERPQDRTPGQTFVNGTLTWTSPDPRWAVVLSGRNLLQSEKPVSATYTPSTGVYYLNFPDPRTFLVTLRFRG
ncbi:MAG: TonB-dependent receptor [Caulobacter sp.]|nr:TonB-dependent receptor [Caulobacter sp.]